jgi:uncharacterized protein YndB with AHSA1/START domain
MAVDVQVETTINRSPADVSAYAADPGNAPTWYANIRSVEWRTEPPVELGSRVDFVAHFLGRRLAYTYEVVEWVPGERLVMRTADGPFPMETTYTWEPAGEGGTRMSDASGHDPGPGEAQGAARVRAGMTARRSLGPVFPARGGTPWTQGPCDPEEAPWSCRRRIREQARSSWSSRTRRRGRGGRQ